MGKFVRMTLPITLSVILLILFTTTTLHATVTPEIDPTSAIAPVALVAGALLVIRGRIKK
jgi:hypothetical protein